MSLRDGLLIICISAKFIAAIVLSPGARLVQAVLTPGNACGSCLDLLMKWISIFSERQKHNIYFCQIFFQRFTYVSMVTNAICADTKRQKYI